MSIPCKPWALNGLSERLIVSHYENQYGGCVRALNGIRDESAKLDLGLLPSHQLRALKAEEARLANAVALHESYFAALGGDGGVAFTGVGVGAGIDARLSAAITQAFGSVTAWRDEFSALARALDQESGWVLLTQSRLNGTLSNHLYTEHAPLQLDSAPLLVLDMCEHAYHLDFGANAQAYIDAFMRNIDWAVVASRFGMSKAESNDADAPGACDPASISVSELSQLSQEDRRSQVIDVRPRHYVSRTTDMMRGATWRDPDHIDEWCGELASGKPVFVYCAYGYSVGRCVAASLRDRGIDAKYVRGGLSAWYAAGGDRELRRDPVE